MKTQKYLSLDEDVFLTWPFLLEDRELAEVKERMPWQVDRIGTLDSLFGFGGSHYRNWGPQMDKLNSNDQGAFPSDAVILICKTLFPELTGVKKRVIKEGRDWEAGHRGETDECLFDLDFDNGRKVRIHFAARSENGYMPVTWIEKRSIQERSFYQDREPTSALDVFTRHKRFFRDDDLWFCDEYSRRLTALRESKKEVIDSIAPTARQPRSQLPGVKFLKSLFGIESDNEGQKSSTERPRG